MRCRAILRLVHTDARPFVDRVKLQVIGGRGGKGVSAFESVEHFKKKPVGGSGGVGGDVVLEASASVQDLHFSTYVVRGRPGGDASRNGSNGRGGKVKRLMVPLGSLVKEVRRVYEFEAAEGAWEEEEVWEGGDEEKDWSGSEGGAGGGGAPSGTRGPRRGAPAPAPRFVAISSGEEPPDKLRRLREGGGGGGGGGGALGPVAPTPSPLRHVTKGGVPYREEVVVLADLSEPGASVLVARGGAPGQGNKGSTLTFSEQRGEDALRPHVGGGRGESRVLELELKSIADVGLVGFPNAGKSSLLGAVSRAKPRVADYPFTTLRPHVGVVHFRDGGTLTVADIPGLVEGAAEDAGLGHAFLRHIERTAALLYVVDASGRDPAGDLRALQEELARYSGDLPARPSLVVANKMDVGARAEAGLAKLRAATALPVAPLSAHTREGVAGLLQGLRWVVETARAPLKQ
jgi:GTP-binding protein